MRDEVIRIILEAKDKMSGVMRDAERNIDRSTSNISKDLQNLDKQQERYSNNFRRRLASEEGAIRVWGDSLERQYTRLQKRLSSFRKDAEQEIDWFGNTKQGPGGRFISDSEFKRLRKDDKVRDPRAVVLSTAFNSFKEGMQQANKFAEELNSFAIKNEEQLKEAKENLKNEKAQKREDRSARERLLREIQRQANTARLLGLDEFTRTRRQERTEQQDVKDERLNRIKRARKLQFDTEQDIRKAELDEKVYQRKRAADEALYQRRLQFDNAILDLRASGVKGKNLEKATRDLRYGEGGLVADQRVIRKERQDDIREWTDAYTETNRENAAALKKQLQKFEDVNALVRKRNSLQVEKEIRLRKAEVQDEISIEDAHLRNAIAVSRSELERELREKSNLISGKGEADLVKKLRETRDAENELRKEDSRLSRSFRATGAAWSDLTRGFSRGRNDLRGIDKEARRLDTVFAKLGQTVGRFTKNFGNFVNVRWYALISVIQILGQLVLVLGANLVSLASSAALAASALGVGLLSAVSQLIPVFAILHLAFKRITLAYQASNTASADATQQMQEQKQAVQALAEAKKQAARDIVDAIFAERDAQLSLAAANFAVLDAEDQLRKLERERKGDKTDINAAKAAVEEAKQRLAVAKNEGDQAQIQAALEQLAIAKQNLSSLQGAGSGVTDRQIKEQKLAVAQAKQAQKEAKVQLQRQKADTRQIVRAGVKGNQQVVAAIQALQTATLGSNASALAKLDPAEKKLAEAFTRLRKVGFSPITDVIVKSFTHVIERLTTLLENPRFHKAFMGLSKTIGNAITELGNAVTSKGAMNAFIGFIHEAIHNIPLLVKSIENIGEAFGGLANAGAPVVRDLLERFTGLTGSFSGAVNEKVSAKGGGTQTRAQRFITGAKPQLDSWIKLADAIGRVFKYLFVDAAPAGKGLVDALTGMFSNLADFLKNNPEKVNKFFEDMKNDLEGISGALFPLVKVLFSAFTGPNAAAFTKFTAEVVVPGIAMLLRFITQMTRFALWATQIPGIKLFLQFLVFEKTLNKIFPASQHATNGLKKLLALPFSSKARQEVKALLGKVVDIGKEGWNSFRKLGRGAKRAAETIFDASKKIVLALGRAVVAVGQFVWAMATQAVGAAKKFAGAILTTAYNSLKTFVLYIYRTVIPALVRLGIAMYASLGPWGIAIGAAIILFALFHDKIIHYAGLIINWIKDHWKLLLAILTGPFSLVIIAIIKWKDQIIGFFEGVISWVRNNWKTILVSLLLAPFALSGLVIGAIHKFKDKILDIFGDIWKGIKKIFGKVSHWLTHTLTPHVHIHYWHGIPYPSITFGDEKDEAKDIKAAPGHPRTPGGGPPVGPGGDVGPTGTTGAPKKKKRQAPVGVTGPQYDVGGTIAGSPGQAVPIIAHAGEWILNKAQQLKLAKRLGTTVSRTSEYLFGAPIQTSATPPNSLHDTNPTWAVVSQTDEYGAVVYFTKLPSGVYYPITERAARRLEAMKRTAKIGHKIKGIDGHAYGGRFAAFAAGGIVRPSFAMGGIVTSPQNSYGGSSWSTVGGNNHHKKIEQNFKVNTQGETDWNYVLRLAALHAQESF